MKPHTTHFDDCGCKSARLEQENAALRLRVAALEAVLRGMLRRCECPMNSPDSARNYCAACEEARATLSGSDSALREMMMEAAKQGAQAAYDDHNSQDSGMGPREPDPEAIVDRILGTHNGGGE